jgi:hypothetical protein
MSDAFTSAALSKVTQSPPGRRWRLFPLAIAALAMAAGLWSGLVRLGVALPAGMPPSAELHGALMISGFLGTLISLERAVALGRWWAYAAPMLSAAGAVALLAGTPRLGAAAFIAAGGFLLAASARIVVRQPALFTVVLAAGAACWAAGSMQWLMGYPMPAVSGWWLIFLILTIAAERLELSRIASPPPSSQVTFALAVLLLLIGSAHGELAKTSAPYTAAGLLGCAAWLLHHDIARRTIRVAGLPRFSALSILAGIAWLAVAGSLMLLAPPGATAFSYDAAVHAIAIGFVLSMVFGHAPIILPAVIGARVRYTAFAYVPLALLHASVLLRVVSDMLEWVDLRAGSGILTVLALVSYAATLMLVSGGAMPRRPA